MKKAEFLALTKKIGHTIVAVKAAGTAVKVGAKVYSLIPKYETIKNVDTDALTQSIRESHETPIEEIIEEKKFIAEAMAKENMK